MLLLDRRDDVLRDSSGRRFDVAGRRWVPDPSPGGGDTVSLTDAVAWLQGDHGRRLRVPIGVIGPRDADAAQQNVARELGGSLARMGLSVLCGGRQGVMEAVCRGVAENGGLSIGLLPEADAQCANPYVSLALATGIGEARNALIARAAFCLVAVGNSFGTLSEVALGLQFGKPVLGLAGAADLREVRHCADVGEAIERIARLVLALET